MANFNKEISRLVQNPEDIRKDLSEAMELVREHFRAKYLRRVQQAVKLHRQSALENPPREVALLNVLKEFAHPHEHPSYDRTAEMLLALNSWQELRQGLGGGTWQRKDLGAIYAAGLAQDPSIHPDGIYETDPSCKPAQQDLGERFAQIMVLMSILSGLEA